MHIAMIGQKGLPTRYGGIERHVEELAAELALRGHQVVAYARSWYTPRDIASHRGIRVVHTPTIWTKHFDAITHTLTATLHALLFIRPQVYHFHGVGPALLSFLPRLLHPSARVVATFHCNDRYHQKWGPFAKLFLKWGERAACVFAHETITVSQTLKKYCLNEYEKNTTYVPNGVALPAASAPAAALGTWGLTPGRYAVMVSRLVKHKGAHYLIDAWKRAQANMPHLVGGYKLAIVGDSAFTDEYVAELRERAQGSDSIVFTGWQAGAELEALYAHAALLVHPSENEGLPLTVLQAMAHGKAALVSDIPEHQELVQDPRFRVPVADSAALAERLAYLLPKTDMCAENGLANRQRVRQHFSWHTAADATEQVYAQAFAAHPAMAKETEYAPQRA